MKKKNKIPKYPDGGKIPKLKSRDWATEEANYQEATRGANQADGSGISSAELGYKYAKLIAPPGIVGVGISAIEIAKNAYNGDKQDPFDYFGALKIPFVKEGMKQIPKLTKQINKLAIINNTAGKTNDVVESYANGGLFNNRTKKNLTNVGNFLGNSLKAQGDIALSTIGLDNVITDDMYNGNSAKFARQYSDIAGGIAKAALPAVSNIIAPGSGALVSAGQNALSNIRPEDNTAVEYDSYGNPIKRQSKAVGQGVGSFLGAGIGIGSSFMNIPSNNYQPQEYGNAEGTGTVYNQDPNTQTARYGGIKYPNGGMNMAPNAELEKQENTLNPDGTTTQFDGSSHEAGGIPTNLDPGTLIFSDKLKKDGKTFAKLNKPNMTTKEDKILSNKDASAMSKLTSQLMKQAKNKSSMELFEEQEALKQSKLAKYATRLGIDNNAGEFKYGGIKKYTKGGFTPMVNDPNEEVIVPGVYKQNTDFSNVISPNPYDTPMDITDANTLKQNAWTEDYLNNPNAPKPTYPNANSNKTNWGAIATQGASFLANNAGNLYDLGRGNSIETRKYDRATASLLDPTASIRDADTQARNTAYDIKNASSGNAGTYLSNRGALNAQNTINKDRINREYGNANAQIGNQVNQFNTGIANEEILANAKIRANQRNIKQSAVASMGSNVANQMNDIKNTKMDSKRIDAITKMYPALAKDPEMLKYILGFK